MSEEQKKQVEGVLREMKHMNPQQIEVMIAYMQGVATAAKLMSEKKKAGGDDGSRKSAGDLRRAARRTNGAVPPKRFDVGREAAGQSSGAWSDGGRI